MIRISRQRELFPHNLRAAADCPPGQVCAEGVGGLSGPGSKQLKTVTPERGPTTDMDFGSTSKYENAMEYAQGAGMGFGGGAAGGSAGSSAGSSVGDGTGGTGPASTGNGDAKYLPSTRGLYEDLSKSLPGVEIGTYRVDDYHEHDRGAMDVMTSDPTQAEMVKQKAFDAGAPYVLWNQTQWNADGTSSPMEDRGSPTQNHMDHVHTAPF